MYKTNIAILSVKGRDRLRFIQSLGSNDIVGSSETPLHHNDLVVCSSFLDAEGKVIDIAKCLLLPDELRIVLNHENATLLHEHFSKHVFPVDDVRVEDVSPQFEALVLTYKTVGMSKRELPVDAIADLLGLSTGLTIASDRYQCCDLDLLVFVDRCSTKVSQSYINTAEVTVLAPKGSLSNLMHAAASRGIISLTAFETECLRLLHGRPCFGQEVGVQRDRPSKLEYSCLEAGLMHSLHFRKGCYVGNEAVSRTVAMNAVRRKLSALEIAEEDMAQVRAALQQSSEALLVLVDEEGEEAGTLTSLTPALLPSPFLYFMPCNRALGYVRTKLAVDGSVMHIRSAAGLDVGRCTVVPAGYPQFSAEASPAPPVSKLTASKISASVNADEEKRKAAKLKAMEERLATFKQAKIQN